MPKNECTPPLVIISKFLPEYTGAALRTQKLYENIFSRNVSVICGSTETFSKEKYTIGQFIVTRLPSQISGNGRLLQLFFQFYFGFLALFGCFLAVRKADIVHVIGNNTVTASGIFVAKLLNKRIIYEAVTENAGASQRFLGIFKLRLSKRATIIAISLNIEKNIRKQGFLGRVWCRPNPVDFKKFKKPSAKENLNFRKKYNIPVKSKLLMFVGKFIPSKKQDFILRVLRELPDDYFVMLVGPVSRSGVHKKRDQDYLTFLNGFSVDNDLLKRTTFIHEFVDASKLIPFADFYLSFSESEGLGTTILEGIASEVCVLANENVPSYRQHIISTEGSYLLPIDEQKVKEFIMKLASQSMTEKLKRDRKMLRNVVSKELIYKKYQDLFISK